MKPAFEPEEWARRQIVFTLLTVLAIAVIILGWLGTQLFLLISRALGTP